MAKENVEISGVVKSMLLSYLSFLCILHTLQSAFADIKYNGSNGGALGCTSQTDLERSPIILLIEQKQKWGLHVNAELEAKYLEGFKEMDRCNLDAALDIFENILENEPSDANWLANVGKALSIVRRTYNSNRSADDSMRYVEKALRMKPNHPLCLQAMAEVQFRMGDVKKSMETAKAVIDIQPDGHAHVLAGILAFKNNLFWKAMKYLKIALKYEAGSHPVVHHCLGQSYVALGMLKEAIDSLKDFLEIQPDSADALRTIANAFKELGDEKLALEYVNAALKLDQRDIKAIMIRGHIYFSTGKVQESIEDYSKCFQIDSTQHGCQYMKALGLATIGRFYESVKASTQVMISNSGTTFYPEYSQSFYLREFSRYLHSNLDKPLQDYRFEEDLDDDLREMWAKNLPWNGKNYTEQPGIEPGINDVEYIEFKEFSNDAKILLCRASVFDELIQYHSDGFMANWRVNRAMGLAIVDVAQTALKYWKSPVSLRGRKGKRFTWRDIYDVAVTWRKLVSMWYPVLWLDMFPKNVIESGLSNHMLFTADNNQVPRYAPYFPRVFEFAKSMIRNILSQKLSTKVQEQLQKASDVKEFVTVLRKASPPLHAAFAVSLQLPSTRRKSSQLDGPVLTLSGSKEDETSFVLQSMVKPARTNQFHSELEFLWGKLAEDILKHRSGKVGVH